MGPVRKAQRTGVRTRQAIAAAALLLAGLSRAATVGELRCEFLVDPQGIDAARPRLSWTMGSGQRGDAQTAYQVLVASSPQVLERGSGDLWDSGKVYSADSNQVAYQGLPLGSLRACYWKVCVWDRRGKRVGMERSRPVDHGSARAHGLEGEVDRAGFRERPRGRARARREPPAALRPVAAQGVLRRQEDQPRDGLLFRAGVVGALLNGERIGDEVLSPGPERLPQAGVLRDPRRQRRAGQGPNAIGVVLGNGRFYAPRMAKPKTETFGTPRLLLQLHLEYEDGSSEDVVSDESWKLSADGPILANNEYDGEQYDARGNSRAGPGPGSATAPGSTRRPSTRPGA
jgi:alpha-L-rhamnosidase